MLKKLCLILILLSPLTCCADEFMFPFSCYPKQVQEKFAEHGKKLDLDGNDRTEESWGFIENQGTNFKIYTYYSATEEDLQIIVELFNEN